MIGQICDIHSEHFLRLQGWGVKAQNIYILLQVLLRDYVFYK